MHLSKGTAGSLTSFHYILVCNSGILIEKYKRLKRYNEEKRDRLEESSSRRSNPIYIPHSAADSTKTSRLDAGVRTSIPHAVHSRVVMRCWNYHEKGGCAWNFNEQAGSQLCVQQPRFMFKTVYAAARLSCSVEMHGLLLRVFLSTICAAVSHRDYQDPGAWKQRSFTTPARTQVLSRVGCIVLLRICRPGSNYIEHQDLSRAPAPRTVAVYSHTLMQVQFKSKLISRYCFLVHKNATSHDGEREELRWNSDRSEWENDLGERSS